MRYVQIFLKYFILFSVGGTAYFLGEILWRGWSHWSMFLLGGMCFVLIGTINETHAVSFVLQMVLGTLIIAALEFFSGLILNVWLGLNIWDYSDMPMNIMGQICVPYIFGWFLLTPACIVLDDYMRYYFFDEEKPKYSWFGRK